VLLGSPFDDQVPFPISRMQFTIDRRQILSPGGGGSASQLTWSDLQLVGRPGEQLPRLILAMASGRLLDRFKTVRFWTDGAASLLTSSAWMELSGNGPLHAAITSVSQMPAGDNAVALSVALPSDIAIPLFRPVFGKVPPSWPAEGRPIVATASSPELRDVPLIDYAIGGSNTLASNLGKDSPTSKSTFSNFRMTKVLDPVYTPQFWDWLLADATIPFLTIAVSPAPNGALARYELRNAKLVTIEYLAEQFGGNPTETISLAFEEICTTGAGITECWNVLTNK
jgi:hypothetical protein